MRNELDALAYGDRRTVPQGFWAVLRIMRLGEYSQYWNPQSQEAIGGPKWNYDDFIIRCIDKPGNMITSKRSMLRSELSTFDQIGEEDMHSKVFAILFNPDLTRAPLVGDVVFEIDKHGSVMRPDPPIRVTGKFDIVNAEPVKGDYGRTEFYLALTKRNPGGY